MTTPTQPEAPQPTPDATANPTPDPADTNPDTNADTITDTAPDLTARIATLEQTAEDLRDALAAAERARTIDRELLLAGVVDIETARTLVERRIGCGASPAEAVGQVRRRRPVLFTQRTPALRATTAPIPADPDPSADLASAARATGDRRLLLDYLRNRRAPA